MQAALRCVLAWTLAAMTGSAFGAIQAFTSETEYLSALAELGRPTVSEGFENDSVWGSVRSTIVDGTHTAPSITSQGITWSSNNPNSEITTGNGPARTGEWGFYELPHGDIANGIGDGFRVSSTGLLFAVGGWIETNTPFAEVNFIVDDVQTIDFDDIVLGTQHQFLGVIDAAGFGTVEVREIEGRPDDQKFIFADDFTIAVPEPSSWLLAGLGAAALFAMQGAGTRKRAALR